MDEIQFWSIIEAGGDKASADPEYQLIAIRKELLKLSPEEVKEFQQQYSDKLEDAYTWDLWAAAYLINGGCSDDGFVYFREWLISRGRAVYMAAVENPDSLAGLTDPEHDDYEFEDLGYLLLEAYEILTGEEIPVIYPSGTVEPKGKRWNFHDDAEILRRLPNLAKVYPA